VTITQPRHHRTATPARSAVLPEPDPVIHTDRQLSQTFIMDCRVKPGNDDEL
jgi:hypothetical protein